MGVPSRRGFFLAGADTFAQDHHANGQDGEALLAHARGVRRLLEDAGAKKSEVLAAALLHHIPTSHRAGNREILARFGPRVASLVGEVAPTPESDGRDDVDRGGTGSARAALLRVADRLHHLEQAAGSRRSRANAAESLRLASAVLQGDRLDRLFPAERRALDRLLSRLIEAARLMLSRASE